MDSTIVAEMIQTTRHLMSSAAGDTPFDLIYFVPHIEAIFFADNAIPRRIFPQFDAVFIPQFGRTQPKDLLEFLFQNGAGPGNLQAFLDSLTSGEIEKLRAGPEIQNVIAFISNNTKAVLSNI